MTETTDQHLEDVVTAIEDLSDLIRKLKFPEPKITVQPSPAAAPEITVQSASPEVTVNAVPNITVEPHRAVAFEVEITERDRAGYLKRLVIRPIVTQA